jgi:hypothetical protein
VSLDTEAPHRPPPRAGGGPRSRGPRGSSRGGPRFGGSRTSQGGSRGGSERRGRRTQEDLDKELDEFMNGPAPAGNDDGATMNEEMAVD